VEHLEEATSTAPPPRRYVNDTYLKRMLLSQ